MRVLEFIRLRQLYLCVCVCASVRGTISNIPLLFILGLVLTLALSLPSSHLQASKHIHVLRGMFVRMLANFVVIKILTLSHSARRKFVEMRFFFVCVAYHSIARSLARSNIHIR